MTRNIWRIGLAALTLVVLTGCASWFSFGSATSDAERQAAARAAALNGLADDMAEVRRTLLADDPSAQRLVLMEGDLRLMASRAAAGESDQPVSLGPSVQAPSGTPGSSFAPPPAAVADFGEGQYSVHLASYRDPASVPVGARQMQQRYRDLLGDRSFRSISVHLGDGRGTFHRLKAGPYASAADARRVCERIRSQGGYCAVEDFSGSPVAL